MAEINMGDTVRFLPNSAAGGIKSWAMDPEDDGQDGFSRWISGLDGLLGEVTDSFVDSAGQFVDVKLQDDEELWEVSAQFFELVPGVVVLAARRAA
jgi:hypothetical protein